MRQSGPPRQPERGLTFRSPLTDRSLGPVRRARLVGAGCMTGPSFHQNYGRGSRLLVRRTGIIEMMGINM